LPETDPRTAQHVASRYTDYAIPAPWMDNIKMDYKKTRKGGCELDLFCLISDLHCGVRSSPFWDVGSLDWDQRCWTAYLFHLQESEFLWTAGPLKVGPIGCAETSVTNNIA
jgi:hypothetical protein